MRGSAPGAKKPRGLRALWAVVLLAALWPNTARAEDPPASSAEQGDDAETTPEASEAADAGEDSEIQLLPPEEIVGSLLREVQAPSASGSVRLLRSPLPIGVLEGDQLAVRRRGTLGATLAREPGLSPSSFGPGASRPLIRGQGGERIRVLLNGTGTLDVAGISDDHAVPVDASAVRRIEMIRGPAALRYGARAIGGVVYVEDDRVPSRWMRRRFQGHVGGALGSADRERSGSFSAQVRSGRWQVRAAGFARRTDDIEIPGFAKSQELLDEEGNPTGIGEAKGTLPNSDTRSSGGTIGVARIDARGFVGAALGFFETEYGVPSEPDVHIELDRTRVDVRGLRRCLGTAFESVAWDLAYAHYRHTEFEGSEAGTIFEQDAFDGRVEAVRRRLGRTRGSVGLECNYADLAVSGEEALLPEATTATAALFAHERLCLSPTWSVDFGGRYELTSIRSVQDETFHAVSASVGAVWSPSRRTSVALSGAYTSRAPTAFELYADGPHIATDQYEVGDPSLGLERLMGADLTFRREGRTLTTNVTGFAQRYGNYIGLRDTGAVDPGSGLEIHEYHETRAAFYGFEGEVAVHAWKRGCRRLDFIAQGDYVRATDLDASQPLPRIPPLRLGCGVFYEDGRWSARADWLHAFAHTRTAPGELRTDGYDSVDASVAYALRLSGRSRTTLRLTGTNLLDEEIRYSTSFLKDLAPARGRSVLVSLEADF